MKPTDADRDLAFDRLIARGLEGETDATGSACPDADLLAAWFDRSLSSSEAERIEAHASGCGSCQQILADLARSEPVVVRAAPEPAPARPWHWHWRWLVPVATAAVVIVAVGNRTLRAPGPAPAEAPTQAASRVQGPEPAVGLQQKAETPPSAGVAASPPAAVATQAAPPAPAEPSQPLAAPARVARKTPPVTADAVGAPAGIVAENKMADRPQPPTAQPRLGGGAAAGAQKAATAEKAGTLFETVVTTLPQAPPPPPAPSAAMKPVSMRGAASVAGIEADSPTGNVTWRVAAGGSIERSTDRRATWQHQDSGVRTGLMALSAASDTVCWAVGIRGVVLRTTDGVTWERLAPPAEADLVAVKASSGLAATVTTSDRAEYQTIDGGRTWKKTR